jgi:hypothetical protein
LNGPYGQYGHGPTFSGYTGPYGQYAPGPTFSGYTGYTGPYGQYAPGPTFSGHTGYVGLSGFSSTLSKSYGLLVVFHFNSQLFPTASFNHIAIVETTLHALPTTLDEFRMPGDGKQVFLLKLFCIEAALSAHQINYGPGVANLVLLDSPSYQVGFLFCLGAHLHFFQSVESITQIIKFLAEFFLSALPDKFVKQYNPDEDLKLAEFVDYHHGDEM